MAEGYGHGVDEAFDALDPEVWYPEACIDMPAWATLRWPERRP